MRKFRHLLGAIKNADAELLGSGGEVFFEDTKALSELLRCFDIFSWFVAHPNCQLFQYTTGSKSDFGN